MRFKLINSRLVTILIRSSFAFKVTISSILSLLILFGWYFGLYEKQRDMQSKITAHILDLNQQKKIFDEVLLEYKDLNFKFNKINNSDDSQSKVINYSNLIIDQAHVCDLNLQNYTLKKNKDGSRQLNFNFNGSYHQLLTFLSNLDHASRWIYCHKLKLTSGSHRLQIDYVCGIHTFVK
jgi:hypothetical protein